MPTLLQVLSSLAVVGILTLVAACEIRPGPEAKDASKMSNASQGSAEGLVIVGLLAMKKLRQCSENPHTPCGFNYDSPRSGSD